MGKKDPTSTWATIKLSLKLRSLENVQFTFINSGEALS
jgi:hypothetical protein